MRHIDESGDADDVLQACAAKRKHIGIGRAQSHPYFEAMGAESGAQVAQFGATSPCSRERAFERADSIRDKIRVDEETQAELHERSLKIHGDTIRPLPENRFPVFASDSIKFRMEFRKT